MRHQTSERGKREQNAAVFVRFAATRCRTALLCASLSFLVSPPSFAQGSLPSATDSVSFQNGPLALGGVLYKPEGDGPFPAFLFNHGSAPGRLNDQAFEEIGPVFRDRGWVFFAPYRRGQGLSAAAGPFIGDEIAGAQRERALRVFPVVASCIVLLLALLLFVARRRRLWLRVAFAFVLIAASSAASYAAHLDAGATAMVASLETDHLDDHLAARTWLSEQAFVDPSRIATGGNSFGGIVTVLGAERVPYCAAVDAAGGAESWRSAPRLRDRMTRAVRNARAPIFFFQASNDYSLVASRTLSEEMSSAGRANRLKIYPAFGASAAAGHSFAWRGSAIWAADVFQFLETHCAA